MSGSEELAPGKEHARKHRSIGRRILRWLALFVLGLVALIPLALVGAKIYLTDARLTEIASKLLADNLAGKIQVKSIHWSLPVRVTIKKARIVAPEGDDVLTADRLFAELQILPLLKKTIRLSAIEADALHVGLVPPPEGSTSTSAFTLLDAFQPAHPSPPSPETSPPWTVQIDHLDLKDSGAEVKLPSLEIAVSGLAIRGGVFAYAPELIRSQASIEVDEIHLHLTSDREEPIDLGPIRLDLEHGGYEQNVATGGDRIDLDRALIRGLGSSIKLTAHLKRTSALPLQGDVEGKLAIAAGDPEIASLLPPDLAEALDLEGEARIRFWARGSTDDATAEIALEGSGLRVLDVPLERIAARAEQHQGTATLDRFELALKGSSIRARGQVDTRDHSLPHRIDLFAWNVPVRTPVGRFVDRNLLPETLTATASIEGRSLNPSKTELKASIALDGLPRSLTRGAVDRLEAAIKAKLFPDHLILQPLAIHDGTEARHHIAILAQGRAPLDAKGRLDLTVEVLGRALGPLLRRFGVPVKIARLDLAASAKGTPDQPAIGGVIALRGVEPPGVPPADARMVARYGRGLLTLDDGQIAIAGGRIELKGSARILDRKGRALKRPEIDATLLAKGIQIAPFAEGALAGALTASATVSGDTEDYHAQLDVAVPELAVGGSTLAAARIVAHGDHRAFQVDLFSFDPKKGGHLRASGDVRLEDQALHVEVKGRDLPLSAFAEAAQLNNTVSGSIALDLTAKGSFDTPELNGSLAITRVAIDDRPAGELRADVSGDKEHMSANATYAGRAGRLDLAARYRFQKKELEARAESKGLKIRKLPFVESMDLPADGVIALDVGVNGPLPFPKAEGSIELTQLELDGDKVGNGQVNVRLATLPAKRKDSVEYRIDLDALDALTARAMLSTRPHVGGGKIAGTSSTTPPLPFTGEVTAELHDVALEDLVAAIDERGIATHIDGRLKATLGERAGELRGSLVLDRLEGTFGESTIKAREPVRIDLAGEDLVIRSLKLKGTEGSFEIAGHAGSQLDLRADGAIELAFIEPLVPQLAEASGIAKVGLKVQGTSAAPRPSGQVELVTPIDLRPRGQARVIHLEKAHLVLSPDRIQVQELSGGFGSGSFEAQGAVALKGFTPAGWDVSLKGENLPIETRDLILEANADLHATGRGAVPKISGTVDITRGRYIKQLDLDRFNFLAKKPPTEEEPETVPEDNPTWLSDLVLDLHAQSTGAVNLKVDAAAFATDVNLTTDLRVTGSGDQPRVEGRVTVEDGYLRFPAAKLPLTGAIDFVPTLDEPLRPLLALTAEGDVRGTDATGRPRDYHVVVTLKGSMKHLAFDLSGPELSRTETLSLLITGNADLGSIAQGGSSDQAGLSSSVVFAGSQLAGPVSKLVESQLQQALNLQLELRTEVTSAGFRVVAAKDLTRRLRIEGGYGRSLIENQAVASTMATARLTDRLLFEGGAQTVNTFGESVASLQEGAAGSLALKLRLFGN